MNCALVTGGSRGIGRAICVKLASMGYYVLINYKGNLQKAEETLEAVKAAGSDGELLPFDVANREEVQAVLNGWMEANTGKVIEVLVNNDGIKDDVLLMRLKDEQWDNVLDTSLGGFFNVTRIIVNSMLRQRYVHCKCSIVKRTKRPCRTDKYSAAKGGVIAATKALTGSRKAQCHRKCRGARFY